MIICIMLHLVGFLQPMFITVCKPIFYTFVPLFLRLSSDDGTRRREELREAYRVSSESESTHLCIWAMQ